MTSMGGEPGTPDVTIAIPTIDRPEFLRRAIASVLAQKGESFEIVVSDNASDDDMSDVVRSFRDDRIRYQRHQQRLTMTENWNSCLRIAQGQFFLLLSDDDALCLGGLRALRQRLSDERLEHRVGVSYGRTLVVDPADGVLWRTSRGRGRETIGSFASALFGHKRTIYPCSTLLRKSDLLAIGGYDGERFGTAADLAAAMAVGQRVGFIGFVDADVSRYTEHGGNLTTHQDAIHWAAGIRAVEQLAALSSDLDADERARLHRRAEEFAGYFVMDVVLRREIRLGLSPLRAWLKADTVRAQIVPGILVRSRARAFVKALYVWLRGARAGNQNQ